MVLPLIVGATVGLLIMFIAPITQASFNPARDLGPRLMLLVMGFGSVALPGPNRGLSLIATTIGPIIGGIIGALFFDKVMRPNIPGHEVEGSHVTTLSQLAYDPTMEVRRETLHGAQGGSLSPTVANRFLAIGDPDELNKLARSHFQVQAASMYPDARPTLAALATMYKLGVVANPSEQHIAALKRDGLMQYFDVVVHAEVELATTTSPRM